MAKTMLRFFRIGLMWTKPGKTYRNSSTNRLTDIQRKGFESVLSEYQFDLDEEENLIVKDKSGNFVPSKQKAGSFADALELMDMLAEATLS